jgi:hypothetical protein
MQHLGDRRGQRGLAVVDVPDGADVDVRLVRSNFALATSGSFWSLCSCRLRGAWT